MALNKLMHLIFCALCFSTYYIHAQRFNIDGGVLLKTEITLGNQNQWFKVSVFGFGAANYGDLSVESGLSFASYYFLKRHTVKQSGFAYSYDFFALSGIGKNTNLLGASVFNANTGLLFNANGEGGFNGIGLGFGKDYLPDKLKPYGIRNGALLLRFSNAEHSIHLNFSNDLKYSVFYGEGTDYATTGALTVGFTSIRNHNSIYQLGLGLNLFTARPNYSRLPRNPINSDDGRKNVWFTLPPFKDLFYGNIYGYGYYQDENYALNAKLGVNSQKAGAYIQNILHDGYGLNPRFPWRVETKDKLFFETTGALLYTKINND